MTSHSTRGILPLLVAASLLLTACSDDTSRETQQESPTKPSSGETDGTTDSTTDVLPSWKLLSDEPEDVPLKAGSYGLTAYGLSGKVAVIEAPEGYQRFEGWTFVTGAPFHAMGFVTADRVPPDPCGSKGHDKFDAAVDPGPSVEDLADALVAQNGTATSEPAPVTVDNHRGLYLTYQVAKGIDVLTCEASAFDIFDTGRGSWWLEASRERAAIWILDVDGERLVMAWVAVPGVKQAEMRAMTRMVQSAHFIEP